MFNSIKEGINAAKDICRLSDKIKDHCKEAVDSLYSNGVILETVKVKKPSKKSF